MTDQVTVDEGLQLKVLVDAITNADMKKLVSSLDVQYLVACNLTKLALLNWQQTLLQYQCLSSFLVEQSAALDLFLQQLTPDTFKDIGQKASAGGVGEGQHQRSLLVDRRHVLEDGRCEGARDGADSDDDARLEGLHYLQQVSEGLHLLGVGVGVAGAVRADQVVNVEHGDAASGVLLRQAFVLHLLNDEVGNAEGGSC
ncbi:hypothetical protein TYRP_017515 [Tyrophagus putrescentiae]|nr:hypothetical protein TYRP_017515 [Tyrophagus putrescentiae]